MARNLGATMVCQVTCDAFSTAQKGQLLTHVWHKGREKTCLQWSLYANERQP